MPASTSILGTTLVGALAGALFGVAFGALASVFDGGPPAAQAIGESWGWFCLLGMALAFGYARARSNDERRSSGPP